ncbi:MAG: hypothetical protein Q8P01_04630, partial [bacterium]|nr:hypothetical protein [bacterium]
FHLSLPPFLALVPYHKIHKHKNRPGLRGVFAFRSHSAKEFEKQSFSCSALGVASRSVLQSVVAKPSSALSVFALLKGEGVPNTI